MTDVDPAAPSPLEPAIDLSSPEFQDYDGPIFETVADYDFSQLWTRAALRGVAAIVVALILISAPSRTPRLLSAVLAVLLIAWSIGGFVELIRGRERTFFTVMRVIVLAALAIVLIAFPRFNEQDLGRIIGAGLVGAGFVNLFRLYRERHVHSVIEPLIGALLYVALGAALLASPASLIHIALIGFSFYWFIAGVLTLVTNLKTDAAETRPTETWRAFLEWVQSRPNTADDRHQLYSKIFYEGDEGPRRLSRFFTLMGFATTIAFFGVVSDSTAVVIGAMLVAPLMTPLMGTSLAMVMGWPRRVTKTGLVALGGIAFAIGLSIIFGWGLSQVVSPVFNTQVASRIQPTLIDLVIAIAAGAAGAFAMSRPDVSDSLPGVAVAIALVPPLAVVGLMISQNDWDQALGALLLFTTNLVAILLVGALVFVLTGVVPVFQLSQNARRVKLSLGMASILAVAVIAVLGVSTEDFQADLAGTTSATEVVDEWLDGTELTATSVDVTATGVTVDVRGPNPPPEVATLASQLEQEIGHPVNVTVNWDPRMTYVDSLDD